MNIALAFHNGDKDQAQRWLEWCAEIGMEPRHDLFIMPAKDCHADHLFDERCAYRKAFRSVTHVPDAMGVKSEWSHNNSAVRDASGPNSTIRQFVWFFYSAKKGPWLFMEPDAIPLCPDWLDKIETEYNTSGKRFMGAVVRVPGVPVHSTGIMVLPENATDIQMLMTPGYAKIDGQRVEIAFDVAAAREILVDHHETKLIQHVFRGPSFTSQEQFEKDVRPDAVLFHTCKDGSLLPFLRKRLDPKLYHSKEELSKIHGELQQFKKEESSLIGKTSDSKSVDAGSTPASPATPTNRSVVYTYFEPVDSMDRTEQEWLLSRWSGAWVKNGWQPVILNEEIARTHPYFNQLSEAFDRLPSANPKAYERACWLRHVAMVQVGGGLLTDYDVMPYDFTPEMLSWPPEDARFPLILADKNPCPCAVIGTAKQFNQAAFEFANKAMGEVGNEHGKAHISDQQCVQNWKWPAEDICFQYGRDGWQTARMVHYSHSSCGGRKRRDIIPVAEEIRKQSAPEVAKVSAPTTPEPLPDTIEQIPDTWIHGVRARLDEITPIVLAKVSRKQEFHKELRKRGLLGQPKKRMRKTLV